MDRYRKKKILGVLVWLGIFFLTFSYNLKPSVPENVKGSYLFYQEVEEGKIQSVTINYPAHEIYVYPKSTEAPYLVNFTDVDEDEIELLYQSDIRIDYAQAGFADKFYNTIVSTLSSETFLNLIPLFFLFFVFFFIFKNGFGTKGGILPSIKNAKDKIVTKGTDVTFEDIGGLEDMKEGVKDIIAYFNEPKPWIEAGVRLPRGVILEGPPGTGKTLFARALASEAKATFFSTSGPEFTEMFVGVGAARVRDLFENAKTNSPAIIFIDEIDAIGKKRHSTHMMGSDEWDNTLNQLLACMDGFQKLERVLVVGATNRLDVLDPALLRAGRFDRNFSFSNLPIETKTKIFEVHLRERKLEDGLYLNDVSSIAPEITGAEIETMVNEASMFAVRRFLDLKEKEPSATLAITLDDFRKAYLGIKSKQFINSKIDKLMLDSSSQFIQCEEELGVELELSEKVCFTGTIIWANNSMIKLRDSSGDERIIVKNSILSLKSV